jgi:hypothetical protein
VTQSWFIVVHFVGSNQISTSPQDFPAVYAALGVQDIVESGRRTRGGYPELALFEFDLEEYGISKVFDGPHGESRKLP